MTLSEMAHTQQQCQKGDAVRDSSYAAILISEVDYMQQRKECLIHDNGRSSLYTSVQGCRGGAISYEILSEADCMQQY